jgi:hypothetical protein
VGEFAATHDWYRRRGLVDVVKNPSEWKFISEKEYREHLLLIGKKQAAAGSIAQTDNGYFMMRVPSEPVRKADRKYEAWLKATYGNRRAPSGAASLSRAELEKIAVEIPKNPNNSLWEWYETIARRPAKS